MGCLNKLCNNVNGVCTISCVKGYWGNKCSKKCGNCQNYSCNRRRGNCPHGCSNGFWGDKCSFSCANCKKGICHKSTGICIRGCNHGHFGIKCKKTCDLTFCLKDGICSTEVPGCFKNKKGSIYYDKSRITTVKTTQTSTTKTTKRYFMSTNPHNNKQRQENQDTNSNSMIPSQVILFVFAGLFILFLPLVLILIYIVVRLQRRAKKTSRELTQMRQIAQPVDPNTYSSFPSLPSQPPQYSETFQACAATPRKEPITTNEYEAVSDETDGRVCEKRKLSAEYLECLPSGEEDTDL